MIPINNHESNISLQVATSRSDAAAFLVDHLQHITGIFGRARQYEQLYTGRSPRLTEAVPRLFAHILNFLIRARIYFARNMISKSATRDDHTLNAVLIYIRPSLVHDETSFKSSFRAAGRLYQALRAGGRARIASYAAHWYYSLTNVE